VGKKCVGMNSYAVGADANCPPSRTKSRERQRAGEEGKNEGARVYLGYESEQAVGEDVALRFGQRHDTMHLTFLCH
jgi:hypothetical protein